ncbi:MAG: hypothetical protein ACYDA9_02150 [Terriglobia bacterium]
MGWIMWPAKNRRWLSVIFRSVTAATLALVMAPPAPAAGTEGAGGRGPNPLQIKISFPHLVVIGGDAEIGTVQLSQPAPQGGAKVTITSDTTDVKTSPITAQSLSVPAGAGSLAMLPCQQYFQTFLVQAGMDKSTLGTISCSAPPKDSIEVFNRGKTTLIRAIKGCEPKK